MEKVSRHQIARGSDVKIEVILSNLPEGETMDTIDFTTVFSCGNTSKTFSKDQLYKLQDGDSFRYIAAFSTEIFPVGDMMMKVSASVPDDAFPDGKRDDIIFADTKVTLI